MKSKESTETKTVKQFIIILLVVILIAIGIYFITTKFVNTSDSNNTDTEENLEYIDPTVAIVGTMLKKLETDYYVMLFDTKDIDVATYYNLLDKYESKEDSIRVYTVDLSNPLNSKYMDRENPNLNTTNIEEMRFGAITVLKVVNNQVEKSYSTIEDIKKVWKLS